LSLGNSFSATIARFLYPIIQEGLKPMDSVIERLTALAIDEEPLSKEEKRRIRQSLKEIKQGKVRLASEVFKRLNKP